MSDNKQPTKTELNEALCSAIQFNLAAMEQRVNPPGWVLFWGVEGQSDIRVQSNLSNESVHGLIRLMYESNHPSYEQLERRVGGLQSELAAVRVKAAKLVQELAEERSANAKELTEERLEKAGLQAEVARLREYESVLNEAAEIMGFCLDADKAKNITPQEFLAEVNSIDRIE